MVCKQSESLFGRMLAIFYMNEKLCFSHGTPSAQSPIITTTTGMISQDSSEKSVDVKFNEA